MAPKFTRRQIRSGPPSDADDHWEELIGSIELSIFHKIGNKLSGFIALKGFLETHGCQVLPAMNTPNLLGSNYTTILIARNGEELPIEALKRAHAWAHRRNLSHIFFKASAGMKKNS